MIINKAMNIISITSKLHEIEEKLNELAYKMDSPFFGMVIFIVLMVIAFIAIKSYSSK